MNNTKRRKSDFSNQKLEKNTKLKNLVKNFFLRSFSRPLALKKLDELIFKYFLPTFVITFFISLFVIVCQFLYVWMDEIVGKGLDWPTIFEFLFFLVSYKIPMALPLAVLLASLMTYGNLGEQYELVVLLVPEQFESLVLFVPEHLETFVPGLIFVLEQFESAVLFVPEQFESCVVC